MHPPFGNKASTGSRSSKHIRKSEADAGYIGVKRGKRVLSPKLRISFLSARKVTKENKNASSKPGYNNEGVQGTKVRRFGKRFIKKPSAHKYLLDAGDTWEEAKARSFARQKVAADTKGEYSPKQRIKSHPTNSIMASYSERDSFRISEAQQGLEMVEGNDSAQTSFLNGGGQEIVNRCPLDKEPRRVVSAKNLKNINSAVQDIL